MQRLRGEVEAIRTGTPSARSTRGGRMSLRALKARTGDSAAVLSGEHFVKLKEKVSSLGERLASGTGVDISGKAKDGPYEMTLDRITNVENFFRFTEAAGKVFFDQLDADGDGLVTVDDLKREMRRRNLPEKYAYKMMRRCSKRAFFPSRKVNWEAMKELMNEREWSMLRAYSSLGLSDKSGTISEKDVKKMLNRLGKDSNDSNVTVMVEYLTKTSAAGRAAAGVDMSVGASADVPEKESEKEITSQFSLIKSFFQKKDSKVQQQQEAPLISYADFRNFIILLPPETIRSEDPSTVWFNAATIIPAGPAIVSAGTMSTALVVRSAIAGGLASGTSTLVLHPLDTLKTRLQASVGDKSLMSIIRAAVRGGKTVLFRGSVPAVVGAACSHGTRTGVYEISKIALASSVPFLPVVQIQGLSSAAGTLIGTGVRIPCEVLKQQLQNGNHPNVARATVALLRDGGVRSLFRGTAATLAREVPFYVLGMVMYEQLKDGIRQRIGRDLRVYETIAVGAMSGAIAAAATTPFDVIKTRMMTGTLASVSMIAAANEIITKESFLALFRGVVPRMLWIAPLGAMNFAGYELAKRAMENDPIEPEPEPEAEMALAGGMQ